MRGPIVESPNNGSLTKFVEAPESNMIFKTSRSPWREKLGVSTSSSAREKLRKEYDKGGKKLSFRAVVIIGNENGQVGIGVGKADDVVGAVPAHLFAGIWGTLAVPLTNADASFSAQLIGVLSINIFVFVVSYIVFSIFTS